MTIKVVINTCFGGFSISRECAQYMAERGHELAKLELADAGTCNEWYGYGSVDGDDHPDGYERDDPLLVEAVEKLGEKANNRMSDLRVVEIPDGVCWYIHEYDGREHVAEMHRTWY